MRYFVVEMDKKYVLAPKIINWFQIIDIKNLNQEGYEKIPRRTILPIQSNPETNFLDLVSIPFFMMSEMLKDCVSLYEPNLNFKEMILLDKKYKKMRAYFHPMLCELECLTENSIFNMNHSELKKIEISEDSVKDKAIFRIAKVDKTYIVVRLDLLESWLRRGATGLSIKEIGIRKNN